MQVMFIRTCFLLLGTVAGVLALDQLTVVLGLPGVRGTEFYTAALAYPAALNETFYTLWYAETGALIIFPLVLYALRKTVVTPILPWLIAMIIMGTGLVSSVIHGVQVYRQNSTKMDTYSRSAVFHSGASYLSYPGELDTMLSSIFPYFLRAQLPVIAAIGAGYSIRYTLEHYRKKSHNTYPQKLS